jgi:hypothetical protein
MIDQHDDECFVVMPFGSKPFVGGRTYDFDKVYRVIICRAIRNAELRPIRADERKGSSLIHSDMFLDLRDRRIVLADLSLENPNVYYELGIRHVMSPTGTILMCRSGTMLPFDVKLSRVIFYKFDGEDLDWEEAERTVTRLTEALQEAKRRKADSPVHALLEYVLSNQRDLISLQLTFRKPSDTSLNDYQKALAELWRQQSKTLEDLIPLHQSTIFGRRALGEYCLAAPKLPNQAQQIASWLVDAEQYSLANRLFDKLNLDVLGKLQNASSYSEEHQTVDGAEKAIQRVRETLNEVSNLDQQSPNVDSGRKKSLLAQCQRRLAALLQWRWQLTRDESDLQATIDAFNLSASTMESARAEGAFEHPGLLAQGRLKLLLFLRIRDRNLQRQDVEGHADAILRIVETDNDNPVGISYLHWFQCIVLADRAAADESNARALDRLAADAQLMGRPDCFEIGRRQYALLRRFLENFGRVFQSREHIAVISRHLYARLADMR